ncbi:hypothetical protein [Mycolicibacterium cosmeticum]|uniref:hypothetical protein n=1 Tax=Mycolicibacterium cosmeticum TaxID=258533 RepID=UPI0010FEA919|nr:hypothetical protein [Mycolicibacterium cosmeticum]
MWQEDGESPTKMAKNNKQKPPNTLLSSQTTQKNKPSHVAGRRGVPHQDGKKQQTKTTKHTIEFSNNTPELTAQQSRG